MLLLLLADTEAGGRLRHLLILRSDPAVSVNTRKRQVMTVDQCLAGLWKFIAAVRYTTLHSITTG